MKCAGCHSFGIVRFVDGFGQRRVFCGHCRGSFLEEIFVKINMRKEMVALGQKRHNRILYG